MIIDFRVQPPFKSFLDIHFFRPRPAVEDPIAGNPFGKGRWPNPSFDPSPLNSSFRKWMRWVSAWQ